MSAEGRVILTLDADFHAHLATKRTPGSLDSVASIGQDRVMVSPTTLPLDTACADAESREGAPVSDTSKPSDAPPSSAETPRASRAERFAEAHAKIRTKHAATLEKVAR